MDIRELFKKMWKDYTSFNPQVLKVHKLIEKREGGPIKNDHIALRTFNHPRINRHVIARPFLESGYVASGDLAFEKKKLDATYYLHEDDDLPRVFISELRLEEFSSKLQDMINSMVDEIPDEDIAEFDFCTSGPPWSKMITELTYDKLREESEYAAWVATLGFMVNHFTVSVTDCNSFDNLEQVNSFLKENGFEINSSGGEIKGSPEQKLEQSSIMSGEIPVQFHPDETDVILVPGCYYEFALRYDGFDGFIAGSADKIFESTDKQD